MTERKIDDGSLAKVETDTRRLEWQRPQLRQMDAREAEASVHARADNTLFS